MFSLCALVIAACTTHPFRTSGTLGEGPSSWAKWEPGRSALGSEWPPAAERVIVTAVGFLQRLRLSDRIKGSLPEVSQWP